LGGFLKEADMLLHLPIVILATLSPVAVSDTVPKFDIVRECRFEGGSPADVDRCRQDEAAALQPLMATWTQFTVADKSTCVTEATIGGFSSYVDLLSCLEMTHDANSGDSNTRGPQTTEAMGHAPGVTVGVGHELITPRQAPGGSSR
jgi:hypothetical protein